MSKKQKCLKITSIIMLIYALINIIYGMGIMLSNILFDKKELLESFSIVEQIRISGVGEEALEILSTVLIVLGGIIAIKGVIQGLIGIIGIVTSKRARGVVFALIIGIIGLMIDLMWIYVIGYFGIVGIILSTVYIILLILINKEKGIKKIEEKENNIIEESIS